MTQIILNPVTRRRPWSTSHPGICTLRGKKPRYPLKWRLRGPQSRSGRSGEGENLLPLPVFAPRPVQPAASRHTDCDIPAPTGLGKNLKQRLLNLNPHISVHRRKQSYYTVFGTVYRGADKSLVRPGRKQARKHVRDTRDFNKIETRAVIKLFFPQGKAPKEIHAILTETLASFLPGRAKDLSAPL